MINEDGERVAAPQPPELPPHMLEGMTSAGQKKVFGKYLREANDAPKSAPKTASAKKTSAKRSAKKAK